MNDFFRSCELCIINVNENMKPLQVLGNQKCRAILDSYMYAKQPEPRITGYCTCSERVHKNKQFHAFQEFSAITVHRKYSFEKKKEKKELARFELPSSVIRVLDLAHYTTANDMVILLPL